jgi:peroxiredoxin
MFNLQKEIIELNKELYAQLPPEVLDGFSKSIEDFKTKEVEKKAVSAGSIMPHFSLVNANGNAISSDSLLRNGKLIITFFRGAWCPYCNIQFKVLTRIHDQIKAKGATLVAISPQTNLHYKSICDSNSIDFELLHDKNNAFAEQLGLVLKLQDFVIPYYEQLGVRLEEFNGNKNNAVPIPAVLVVNTKHMIEFAFIDSNYTNRIDLDLLISKL